MTTRNSAGKGTTVKFGLLYVNASELGAPEHAKAVAIAAEQAGFESLWAIEHIVVPQGYETQYPYSDSGRMPIGEDASLPEPLTWLAYVAAVTERIRLCTGVLVLPQRNPLLLAKAVASLDFLSGGRVTLGIGAGWLKEEFDALGFPFEGRGKRLDETIEILRRLWREPAASFEGEHFSFGPVICRPQPPSGSVPIVIGGHSEIAAKRAGRVGDGFYPGKGNIFGLYQLARETAETAGRDPDAIELTSGVGDHQLQDLSFFRRLAEKGVSRVLIPAIPSDPRGTLERIEQMSESIVQPLMDDLGA